MAQHERCVGGGYGWDEQCKKYPRYIRHTQFAGSHYFCYEHAIKESDFGVNDDCKDWEDLAEPICIGTLRSPVNG